jgi:hypothetical protein
LTGEKKEWHPVTWGELQMHHMQRLHVVMVGDDMDTFIHVHPSAPPNDQSTHFTVEIPLLLAPQPYTVAVSYLAQVGGFRRCTGEGSAADLLADAKNAASGGGGGDGGVGTTAGTAVTSLSIEPITTATTTAVALPVQALGSSSTKTVAGLQAGMHGAAHVATVQNELACCTLLPGFDGAFDVDTVVPPSPASPVASLASLPHPAAPMGVGSCTQVDASGYSYTVFSAALAAGYDEYGAEGAGPTPPAPSPQEDALEGAMYGVPVFARQQCCDLGGCPFPCACFA